MVRQAFVDTLAYILLRPIPVVLLEVGVLAVLWLAYRKLIKWKANWGRLSSACLLTVGVLTTYLTIALAPVSVHYEVTACKEIVGEKVFSKVSYLRVEAFFGKILHLRSGDHGWVPSHWTITTLTDVESDSPLMPLWCAIPASMFLCLCIHEFLKSKHMFNEIGSQA